MFSRLTHTSAHYASIDAGVTTSAIDTTGAKLLVAPVSGLDSLPVIADLMGNSWLKDPFNFVPSFFYCIKPITSAVHTFAVSGAGEYASVAVSAYSCLGTPKLDRISQHTTTGPTASISPGSVTPRYLNELLVAGFWHLGAYGSIDSGFSAFETIDHSSGTQVGIVLADLIETSIVAQNPIVTLGASTAFNTSGIILTFVEALSGSLLRRRR